MTSTQQQTQRQIVLAKYRTSNIFQSTSTHKPSGKENQSNNCNTSRNKHHSKQFEPKYENISAKERYLKHFHTNTTPLTKKTFTVIKTKPPATSIKNAATSKKPSPPLQAHDIMCRDMFNGCDTTTYRLRRCKSTFIERSYVTQPSSTNNKRDINARTRCIEYNRSNIFFVDNKPLKTEPSKTATASSSTVAASKPLHHKPQKSFTFKRSLYATNTDWKVSNTEVPSFKRSKSLHSNAFKANSLYKETHSSNLKEKTKAIPSNSKTHFNNIESVSYNILSGEEEVKGGKAVNAQKGFVSESYVIDVPKNFDVTDVNTIKNYFIKEKIHIYGIDESVNLIGNNQGKIRFNVRRNADDKTFQEKLNAINVLIDEKKMKMKKIEDTGKVKQRQKTPGIRLSWGCGGEGRKHGKKNGMTENANNKKCAKK